MSASLFWEHRQPANSLQASLGADQSLFLGWCFWILPGGPHLPSTWDSDCEPASGDLGDRHDSRSDSSTQGGVLLCGSITFPWTLHLLCPERCRDQVAVTMGTNPSNGHSTHSPARLLSSAG